MVIYQENDFQPYMPDVEKYSRGLAELNNQWESVKLLCEINCPEQAKSIMPHMVNVQNSFSSLQNDLINSLISETVKKMLLKTKSKAQAAVDILIRNLYERTADVGFLATDDDIRRFACNPSRSDKDLRYITDRMREYEKKYTVYEEIIILDKQFTVLANLDENNPILGASIQDPLLWETLHSDKDFLESFGYSPLQMKKPKAHIFSKKILYENSGQVAGILCLCFRFENEMQGIFQKLCTDYDGSVITIIDDQNAVIASSDVNHVPLGIQVESVPNDRNTIVYYRGVEYIAKTVDTNGYQGYYGLGWRGHMMIPLQLAFKDKAQETLQAIEPEIMSGLMYQANSFSAKLHEIMEKTQQINYSLKRIIYNGQIIASGNNKEEEYVRLKPILHSIRKTGGEICAIFEKSVQNLFATVISASLREETFLAAHCIDIMDRNLYERANDCRWWALNPTFKALLREAVSPEDRQALTGILQYINSLYTVYSLLFLFDKNGRIVAVSNPEHNDKIGMTVDGGYVRDVLGNNREGRYFVSPFHASPLYDDKYTYIYSASVTDIGNKDKTVGGIGIVFDSEFQFRTMLEEILKERENSFAIYTDRDGRIIASTNEEMPPGDILNLPKRFFEAKNGVASSEIIVYANTFYTVGYACSSGYREYKNSDGYQNDVMAFVFEKLADYTRIDVYDYESDFLEQSCIPVNGAVRVYGTFLVDGRVFGLEQSVIMEAVENLGITCVPENGQAVKGIIEYRGQFVTVLDMRALCAVSSSIGENYDLLIIKLKDDTLAALMVDRLINVIEISEDDILPTPKANSSSTLIKNVVKVNGTGGRILLIIDEQKLLDDLELDMQRLDMEYLHVLES
ncbi:MAG TPA: chemotaxis protein CheW [Syntrophomonas sp.]|nr:chemotaxis protein CheW [Syntrophomonas sp.]